MDLRESHDGHLAAGNVHELPVIYLNMYHMLDCKMHFSIKKIFFFLNGLLFRMLPPNPLTWKWMLGLGWGEVPVEVSQIKVGTCYHPSALYTGKKAELGACPSLIHCQPHGVRMRR